jgi:hypothetical protein
MKRYTCTDYRQEMMLAGLRHQLSSPDVTEAEKNHLKEQIRRLEAEMGMD